MKFSLGDLVYQGEVSGVHNWNTLSGTKFYWHPDWLHIAEDMTGIKSPVQIEANKEKATKSDAEQAIIDHLNKQT